MSLMRMYYSLAILLLSCLTVAMGQDKPAGSKSAQNRFVVPKDASPKELGDFLNYLRVTKPAREEAKDRIRAVYECSAALLESAKSDKLLVLAAEARLSVLPVMPKIDPEYAGQTQAQFVRKLKEHKNPKLAVIAKHFEIMQAARDLRKMKSAQRTALIEEAFGLASKYGMSARVFGLLRTNMAMELENMSDYEGAGRVYERLVPMVASSDDERLRNYGPKLKAAANRCLNLPGKPIELQGKLRDGKEFDWTAYKGKVVLIDFWATWCGPCVQEMPRLKKLYDEYHDRGFEIVGVNMDSSQSRLNRFLGDRDIEWAQLVGDEKNFGWQHPIVVRYGISAVPTQMLVGRDGRVISLNLRGRELEDQLMELFPRVSSKEKLR